MSGTASDKGIIGRVVERLFSRLASTAEETRVEVSYLEIYNEKLFDLLEPKNTDLPIREDPHQRAIFVPGLAFKVVRTVREFEAVYESGLVCLFVCLSFS